jgi:thymidylate synthase
MRVYRGNGLGDFYYALLRTITSHGREVVVRGHRCLELPEPVSLVYEKPGYCWMNIPKRRFNPFFAMAEVYWILSGDDSADWIGYYNKRMFTFRDGENDQLHGAYGKRIRKWIYPAVGTIPGRPDEGKSWHPEYLDQIRHVVRKLREDPNSRQAVINLWDPVRDNLIKSNDIPCNNIIYYSLRDGVLDQTVVIRSNDVVWGTPYNAVQYTHLHALVAGCLEARMGTFTYVVQNIHYYFDLYKETLANLLEKAHEPPQGGPGALIIPNFDTVTMEDFDLLGMNVETIYQAWSKIAWLPLKQARFMGNGYWCQTISWVLWIHRILKEGTENLMDQESKQYLAERILTLGSPLVEMILDFTSEMTKSKLPGEVAQICQKMLQPSNS